MKNIVRIFKKDLKNIFTNWVATVVLIALMVIPSLYALINIKASWDPYGNTSGIKIAVVNEDAGTVFKEKDINIGNQLVEKLEDNDKMGWTFVTKEEAEEGLIMEKYYATIEIPEDFSETVTTLVEKDINNPKIKYTVNEKVNAIAPKLTDAAVKTVKQQLDDNITKTVSGIIFRALDEAGVDIQDNRPKLRRIMDATYELDENMPELERAINEAIDGSMSMTEFMETTNSLVPNINDIADSADGFINTSQNNLESVQADFNEISPLVTEKLSDAQDTLINVELELENLDENTIPEVSKKTLITIRDSLSATRTTNNNIKTKLKNVKDFLKKVDNIKISKPQIVENEENSDAVKKINSEYKKQVDLLNSLKDIIKTTNSDLDTVIDRLDNINEKLDLALDRTQEQIVKLENGEKLDLKYLTDMRVLIEDVNTLITKVNDNFTSESINAINSSFDSLNDICSSSMDLLNQSRDLLPDVQSLIGTFTNINDQSKEKLENLKEKFPDIKNNVHKLSEKFKEIDDKDNVDEILELITNDWVKQSDFLTSPIEISDNRLYPIPNYGTAATPFYLMLCLWIGGYMLSILLTTEVNPHDEEFKDLKHYEVYFGKLLLFLFIGIFQALIASLGALYLLKIYCVHKFMFVAYAIFVSIVFMVMIYTAVSLFGHGGIVFGIVLLVMQVAGTSGNFPIEVNPTIFQVIFPYLPFTYAINGTRQIIAGIVYSLLFKDLFILSMFLLGSIILGLLLKKHTNNLLEDFKTKIKESHLVNG